MTVLSFVRVILHLLQGMATCAFVFPLVGPDFRQSLIRNWSHKLLSIVHVSLEIHDIAHDRHERALVVANHVSWLDIFVINALQPCRFVAKADIRGWPLIGWLCAKTGTIFIARGKQREVRRVYEGLVTGLLSGQRIAFFPEGTTAAQGNLLPFHSNLFEAAIEAGVPVRPYAVRYVDKSGALHPAADFIGDMTFVQSMMLMLRSRGMRAQLVELPLISSVDMDRRTLAQAARESIAAGLAR